MKDQNKSSTLSEVYSKFAEANKNVVYTYTDNSQVKKLRPFSIVRSKKTGNIYLFLNEIHGGDGLVAVANQHGTISWTSYMDEYEEVLEN